jgi:hypothetical protein
MATMATIARYERHARTAEAMQSLNAIARGAAAFYNTSDANPPLGFHGDDSRVLRHFPASSKGSVPPHPERLHGARYQSSPNDWAWAPWRDLGFSVAGPQSYAYSFDSSGIGKTARASAHARGDLDGDGHVSTYTVTIAPDDQLSAVVSPATQAEAE